MVGRFPTKTSVLTMVFGVVEERLKWQKIRMRTEDVTWIEEATKLLEQEPIRPISLKKRWLLKGLTIMTVRGRIWLEKIPSVMGRSRSM